MQTCPILYPESSGSLASGWSPGETLGTSKKICLDWLPYNSLPCFTAEFHPVTVELPSLCYHYIIVQGVVDGTRKFIDAVTGFPGSLHYARML